MQKPQYFRPLPRTSLILVLPNILFRNVMTMTYHTITRLMSSTSTQAPRSRMASRNHLSTQFINSVNLHCLEILSEATSFVSRKEIYNQWVMFAVEPRLVVVPSWCWTSNVNDWARTLVPISFSATVFLYKPVILFEVKFQRILTYLIKLLYIYFW